MNLLVHPPFVISVLMKNDETHCLAVKTDVVGEASPRITKVPIPEAVRA